MTKTFKIRLRVWSLGASKFSLDKFPMHAARLAVK